MTAPAARPLPGPFVASLAYAVRACVPPKRWALLTLPTVAAVLLTVVVRAVEPEPWVSAAQHEADELAFLVFALAAFVLPFSSLIIGDAVLGAERRNGLLTLTWLSPTSFATIAAARWLGGWLVTSVALVPSVVLASVVAGRVDAIGVLLLATLSGSAAYLAVFMAIGVLTRRGMLWSLGFVVLAERTIMPFVSSLAQLSPQLLARTTYAGLGPGGDDLLLDGVPSGWGAVVRLVVVAVVALAVTERALRRVTILAGDD